MLKKLLIVDDSMTTRNRIARVATDPRLGNVLIVGMARDGMVALKLARSKQPDIVTMDLTMPNLDGAECISRIIGVLPEVRILVVSALSDKVTAIRAIKRGAHGFLQKPFDDDALVVALQELMKL